MKVKCNWHGTHQRLIKITVDHVNSSIYLLAWFASKLVYTATPQMYASAAKSAFGLSISKSNQLIFVPDCTEAINFVKFPRVVYWYRADLGPWPWKPFQQWRRRHDDQSCQVSSKYKWAIASRGTGVNRRTTHGRQDGRPETRASRRLLLAARVRM